MPIVSRTFNRAGTLMGMPMLIEQGLATNDDSTVALLNRWETGRVELVPLPRTAGIVAKALDGQTLITETLDTELFGRMRNCLQLGRTQLVRFSPRQPFGPHQGKQIISYQRQWVQLEV